MQTIPNSLVQQPQQIIAPPWKNIYNLCQWATAWMLKFNPCKCKVLHLDQNNPCYSYHMIDSAGAKTFILNAEEECDLGVIIDNQLKFH